MSTAIATKEVEFVAWCHEQVLIRKPEDKIRDSNGRVIGRLTQASYNRQIDQRNIEREARGEEPLPHDEIPWKIEFKNHIFKVPEDLSPEDQETLIEWLRNHPLFETPHGFWQSGAAPDEPKPTLAEQITRISAAAVQMNVDELRAALDDEKATHNRTAVIQAAETALRTIAEAAEPGADGDEGETQSTPPSSSNG